MPFRHLPHGRLQYLQWFDEVKTQKTQLLGRLGQLARLGPAFLCPDRTLGPGRKHVDPSSPNIAIARMWACMLKVSLSNLLVIRTRSLASTL